MHTRPEMNERYFKTRLVKNGPWVIALVRVVRWFRPGEQRIVAKAWRDGEPIGIWDILEGVLEIDKDEYNYRVRLKTWATKQNWPPEARPMEPVDLTRLPL